MKAKENSLDGWQKKDMCHSPLKEREQKIYPFSNDDVSNMLDQLLQIKVIKLP